MPRVLPPLERRDRQRSPVNFRSVLLGLAGSVFICALTPYNDYALNNTFLVGNNLPLGVVMLTVGFVLLINAPLHRYKPAWALSAAELSVALSMALVGCALPSSGFMRYLPASLVMQFWHAGSSGEYRELLQSLHVPRWIYPDFAGRSPAEWVNDPIVIGFHERWTGEGPPPYRAWLRPAITWGIFTFALYGALLCMVAIVRRQWNENERLSFPLAQIHLALIEQPAKGKALNHLFRSRSFWIAGGSVFFLHLWNGCSRYWPQYVPEIPVHYDLTNLFTEPPWEYVDKKVKEAAVFFTVVGVTYFLPGAVAFSLWFFFILYQVLHMVQGSITHDPTVYGQGDWHAGGVFGFAVALLWVGREHWRLVICQAFRGERPGEPKGRYLSYPTAFRGLVGCTALMVGWLWLAGCNPIGAAVMVLLLLLLFLVITRIIAEAGLVHGQLSVPLYKPWQMLSMAGWTRPVSVETFYMGGILQATHYDFREVMPVYASHGMKVADRTLFDDQTSEQDVASDRRLGRRFLSVLFLTLLVSYPVAFFSLLATEYRYAWTQDQTHKAPINDWGAGMIQRDHILHPTLEYQRGVYQRKHSPAPHLAFGFAVTGALALMRLRYAWWPLHPIGFLMMGTFPGQHLWLSIMVGWIAKTLIVRFGGTKLFVQCKPFFLGLIVGESAAAAFWLVMGIVLSSVGARYMPVKIMVS